MVFSRRANQSLSLIGAMILMTILLLVLLYALKAHFVNPFRSSMTCGHQAGEHCRDSCLPGEQQISHSCDDEQICCLGEEFFGVASDDDNDDE